MTTMERGCDTCKHKNVLSTGTEAICRSCGGDDDHWEPKEEEIVMTHMHKRACNECRHIGREFYEEPCANCNGENWEPLHRRDEESVEKQADDVESLKKVIASPEKEIEREKNSQQKCPICKGPMEKEGSRPVCSRSRVAALDCETCKYKESNELDEPCSSCLEILDGPRIVFALWAPKKELEEEDNHKADAADLKAKEALVEQEASSAKAIQAYLSNMKLRAEGAYVLIEEDETGRTLGVWRRKKTTRPSHYVKVL